uniref:3-oxo-5-alpha-steroid 4-dehydrogenase family protein n=1 Tax=Tanacetum cinerariifolium TaxID=118510 RepID=A0A6L2LQZ0_TANCI|nr:3-oxo-5-alpha-steroid 4-dehydrogenase family protein [Tanacetum cinerariifolium]
MEELGLVSILRAAWFLAILPFVIAWVRLPGFGWLQRAMSDFAKRGKMAANSKLMVPHRVFNHFYALGIFWTTTMLVAVWLYAITKLASHTEYDVFSTTTGQFHNSLLTREHVYNVWLSVFMLLLMEAQVIRRYYESLYVFKYSPSARLHISGYICGIVYYIAAPLSLCSFAPEVFKFVKNLANDIMVNGKNTLLSNHKFNIGILVTPFLVLRWYAWLGAAIFLWGWVHQRRCHAILGSLRKNPKKPTEYIIPYGDWFKYVSSPHYTAEIVMYGGLVVASGGADLSLWLLFAFVVANLGFASMTTHKWELWLSVSSNDISE